MFFFNPPLQAAPKNKGKWKIKQKKAKTLPKADEIETKARETKTNVIKWNRLKNNG